MRLIINKKKKGRRGEEGRAERERDIGGVKMHPGPNISAKASPGKGKGGLLVK